MQRGFLKGLVVMAACTTAAQAAPLRVQPVEFIDQQGFERPMKAGAMMLPAGWRHETAVQWRRTQGDCTRLVEMRLRATSADGNETLELLPGEMWMATNFGVPDPQCRRATFDNAQAYVQAWVQQNRPGARWLEWKPRADFVQAPVELSAGPGATMRRWADGGRAIIEWTERGQPVREMVATAVSFAASQMPGLGPQPIQSLHGEARGLLVWRAPAGKLDPRHFDAVWSTMRPDPAWSARVSQGVNAMARENAATQAAISNIHAETGRQTIAEMARRGEMLANNRAEMAAMQQQGYDNRMASQERMQVQNVQQIRGVEPWRDAGGRVVELPAHYPHAWRLRDGSYLLTDDANFKPGRDLGIEGEALTKPAR